jgi:hypothetical protein
MRLNPELESFLKTLKMKYGISELDFAKLLFLLDEWAGELCMKSTESSLYLTSKLVERSR